MKHHSKILFIISSLLIFMAHASLAATFAATDGGGYDWENDGEASMGPMMDHQGAKSQGDHFSFSPTGKPPQMPGTELEAQMMAGIIELMGGAMEGIDTDALIEKEFEGLNEANFSAPANAERVAHIRTQLAQGKIPLAQKPTTAQIQKAKTAAKTAAKAQMQQAQAAMASFGQATGPAPKGKPGTGKPGTGKPAIGQPGHTKKSSSFTLPAHDPSLASILAAQRAKAEGVGEDVDTSPPSGKPALPAPVAAVAAPKPSAPITMALKLKQPRAKPPATLASQQATALPSPSPTDEDPDDGRPNEEDSDPVAPVKKSRKARTAAASATTDGPNPSQPVDTKPASTEPAPSNTPYYVGGGVAFVVLAALVLYVVKKRQQNLREATAY